MPTKTLANVIKRTLENGDKAFIPYIMAGDGGLGNLSERILFLQNAGATAIELGIPFSDPVADGPTIQAAGERALKEGATLRTILKELDHLKDAITIPLIIMTYVNPIMSYGLERFVEACNNLPIKGLIVPDVPLEESEELRIALSDSDIALIPLVSLTSPPERIQKIVAAGEGFIYAVTVNGITGARDGFNHSLEKHLTQLKKISDIPVMAGFGISTPQQVENISSLVDGVIVGSAIVEAFHKEDPQTIQTLIQAAKKKVLN